MSGVEAMDIDKAGPSSSAQTAVAVPPAERKNKGKAGAKRFEIKKWNAVAMWSWSICTDTCAICRNNLYEPSIEYQARTPTIIPPDTNARPLP